MAIPSCEVQSFFLNVCASITAITGNQIKQSFKFLNPRYHECLMMGNIANKNPNFFFFFKGEWRLKAIDLLSCESEVITTIRYLRYHSSGLHI